MGVLSVAEQEGDPVPDSGPPPGAESTSDNSRERVDIAQQFTRSLEQFLSGLIPADYSIKLNWGLLSPIFSVLSGVATSVSAIGVLR